MKKKLPHDGVFTRLRPSTIHGIGVFAIRDITKDTYIFTGDNSKMTWVTKSEIENQEPEIKKLYDDFCIIEGNKYYCPDNFNNLYALRDIKKDEELTVDYATFSEYPH